MDRQLLIVNRRWCKESWQRTNTKFSDRTDQKEFICCTTT